MCSIAGVPCMQMPMLTGCICVRQVRTPEELRAEARKLLQSQLQGQKRDTMPNRPIRHPNFKNVSMAVAADQIRGAEIGEIIIRPSAKATDRICLTMKVGLSCAAVQKLGPRLDVFVCWA